MSWITEYRITIVKIWWKHEKTSLFATLWKGLAYDKVNGTLLTRLQPQMNDIIVSRKVSAERNLEARSQSKNIFLLISFGCFFYFIPMFSLHPPSKKEKMIWSRCELCARWMAFWEIFFDNKKQSLWKTKSWTIKKRKQTTRLDFVGGKAAKCLEIFTLFTQCDPMETDKSEIQCYEGRVVLRFMKFVKFIHQAFFELIHGKLRRDRD